MQTQKRSSSTQKDNYSQQIGAAIEQITNIAGQLADPLTVVALVLEGAKSSFEVAPEMFGLAQEQIPALRQSYQKLLRQLEMLNELTFESNSACGNGQVVETSIRALAAGNGDNVENTRVAVVKAGITSANESTEPATSKSGAA